MLPLTLSARSIADAVLGTTSSVAGSQKMFELKIG